MSGTTGWTVPAPTERTCILCGESGPHIVHGLIRWRDGDPFGSGPRCPDAGACWQRAMDRGDEWLVERVSAEPQTSGSGSTRFVAYQRSGPDWLRERESL